MIWAVRGEIEFVIAVYTIRSDIPQSPLALGWLCHNTINGRSAPAFSPIFHILCHLSLQLVLRVSIRTLSTIHSGRHDLPFACLSFQLVQMAKITKNAKAEPQWWTTPDVHSSTPHQFLYFIKIQKGWLAIAKLKPLSLFISLSLML